MKVFPKYQILPARQEILWRSNQITVLLLLLPWQQYSDNEDRSVFLGKLKGVHCCISAVPMQGSHWQRGEDRLLYQLYCPLQQQYFLINKCVGNMKNSCTAGGNSTTCTYSYNVHIHRGLIYISAADIDFILFSSTERHHLRSELTKHTHTHTSPLLKVI